MAAQLYFVVLEGDAWKIDFDGKQYGPFRTRQEAIREAIDAALRAGRASGDTEVLVQLMNGEFLTQWAYGENPAPGAPYYDAANPGRWKVARSVLPARLVPELL